MTSTKEPRSIAKPQINWFFLKLDITVQYNLLIYRMCGDFFNSILKSNTFQKSSEGVYILIISLGEPLVLLFLL